MTSATLRTVLPLATITGTGMLAMDLYLPAVPSMQTALGLSVPQGQATVAVFLAGLAASQLVWGEVLHRYGPRRSTAVGLALLIVGSVGCALAADLLVLLLMRLLQGIGAGASTVVVPAVIKATLGERDSHKGVAAVSMIEAIVPAAGPVLGTLLLLVVDWRWTFATIAVLALVAAPFALRASPSEAPGEGESGAGYAALLRDGRFVRRALSHSLVFAALFAFVASGPQLLNPLWGAHAFSLTQVVGVAAFIVAASQSGRWADRLGRAALVQRGAWVHVALCIALLVALAAAPGSHAVVLVFWGLFCATLGLRGPAAFADALNVPMAQVGRASALLVLMLLACSAVSTQITAFFLEGFGLNAVAVAMVVLCAGSLMLVRRYPA